MEKDTVSEVRDNTPEYRNWTISLLYDWARTFDNICGCDDEKPTKDGFNIVAELAEKLEKDTCTKEDYENILFHLWQITYPDYYGK